MVLTKEASDHKPKRPLTGYFKFRIQKLMELKDEQNKNQKTKQLYDELDEKEKQKLHDEFQEEMITYHKEMEEWKRQYGLTDKDLKRSTRKKKRQESEESDDQKPIKRKGQSRSEMNKRKMQHARKVKEEKHLAKSRGKGRSKSKETSRSQREDQEEEFSPTRHFTRVKVHQSQSKQRGKGRSSSKGRKVGRPSKGKSQRGRSKSKQ